MDALPEPYSRLLILASSTKKRPSAQIHRHMAALELYDGPEFRLLRSYRAQLSPASALAVLTSNYGLIKVTTPISYYESELGRYQRSLLNTPSALKRNRDLLAKLHPARKFNDFAEIFAYAYFEYRKVIEDYVAAGLFGRTPVRFPSDELRQGLNDLNSFILSGIAKER